MLVPPVSKDEVFKTSREESALTEQLQAWSLRTQNDTPFINSLPPELLVRIIEEVRQAERRSGSYWVASPWTIAYQLVCRRWWDVIRSTPSLWQEIIVYERAEWLEFCLRQCAGALATVHIFHPSLPDETFSTLQRYASSLRAYHVHCDVPQLDYLAGLPMLLATPMPVLETLSLTGPYYEGEGLDVPLTPDLVPRLTNLELRNCTAPREVTVYTPLRSLTLSGSLWTFSYDDFLDILEQCRDLECLSLDEEVLDPFAEELAKPPTGDRRRTASVVLPRLRTLKLTGQHALLFHLLATIHAPQATTLDLSQSIDEEEEEETGPRPTRLLAADSHQRYPFLCSPRAISLSCWDRDPFHLRIRCGPDGNERLSIDYGMRYDDEWPGNANLEPSLVAVMDFFPVASVNTLQVKGHLSEVSAETWQRVFQTLPSLRTLHIQGGGALHALWRGLSRATTASLERDGAVCCPSLSEIVVDDPPWHVSRYKFHATSGIFSLIPRVLRARADAGGARLQKFQLYLQYSDEMWSDTPGQRSAFVEDVKALVGELDYRDGRTEA